MRLIAFETHLSQRKQAVSLPETDSVMISEVPRELGQARLSLTAFMRFFNKSFSLFHAFRHLTMSTGSALFDLGQCS